MRLTLLTAAVAMLTLGFALNASTAADNDKPQYTIKEVMKEAHKEGLLKKVVSGKGSEADAERLLVLYKALAANEPPKGDAESWKTKTEALVQAAQGVVDGKPGAAGQLKKAANCVACHKLHKPS
jgi:cytochrome c556